MQTSKWGDDTACMVTGEAMGGDGPGGQSGVGPGRAKFQMPMRPPSEGADQAVGKSGPRKRSGWCSNREAR